MSEPQFLTIICSLIHETQKAVLIHWLDEENEIDLEIWIPKGCLEEDEFDRENSIKALRSGVKDYTLDVLIVWMRDQEWFSDEIQELIDLL